MILAGAQNGNGIWYFVVSCGGAALHLVWQLSTWDETDNTDSAAKFQVRTCFFLHFSSHVRF